jgi:hypothetical protein
MAGNVTDTAAPEKRSPFTAIAQKSPDGERPNQITENGHAAGRGRGPFY